MTVLQVIYIIIVVLLAFFVSYYNKSAKFQKLVTTLINKAQGMDKTGQEKEDWGVDKLYGILPFWLKGIFTKTILSAIVKNVYDEMFGFAQKLADKAADDIQKSLDSADAGGDAATDTQQKEVVAPGNTGAE